MFFKNDFANIIKNISNNYDNQRDFAIKSGINRNYLSRYMNLKMDKPPKPSILLKLADASDGAYSYMKLMQICGYINYNENDIKYELEKKLKLFDLTEKEYDDVINCFMHDAEQIQSLAFVLKFSPNLKDEKINREKRILLTILNYVFAFIPNDLDISDNKERFYLEFNKALIPAKKMLLSLDKEKIINNMTIYIAEDSSMAPLLNAGDKAYVNPQSNFESGNTILFQLDNIKYVRKIVDNGEYVEFHAMNPYYPIIKKTKKELEDQHFAVIGKVIKVENSSAFK